MEISETKLKELASFIIINLQCHCGLSYEESIKEPCACGWTSIQDWFEDECDMDFKKYYEASEIYEKMYRPFINQE